MCLRVCVRACVGVDPDGLAMLRRVGGGVRWLLSDC